jgi:hypothetical protein
MWNRPNAISKALMHSIAISQVKDMRNFALKKKLEHLLRKITFLSSFKKTKICKAFKSFIFFYLDLFVLFCIKFISNFVLLVILYFLQLSIFSKIIVEDFSFELSILSLLS